MPLKADDLDVHLVPKVFDDSFKKTETNHAVAAGHSEQNFLNRIEHFDAVQRGIEVLFDLRALSLVKCAVELGPLFVLFVSCPFILLLLLMSLKRYKVIEDQ